MFKMFVEDFQSGTVKWGNAWEVRSPRSVSNFANNRSGTGSHTPSTAEPGQNAGKSSTLMDDVRDVQDLTETVQSIRSLKGAIPK